MCIRDRRCDAVRLAIDTLESAGEKLRADVMPRIIKGASERFSTATLGRYSSLGVAHDFSMSYTGDAGTREAEYLSAGSADSAYISPVSYTHLFGLCRVFYTSNIIPYFFVSVKQKRADG